MTVVHATSTYNVEASINAYFKAAFTAMSRPAIITLPSYVENMPEVTANLPSFSFVHLPTGSLDMFQGRHANETTTAMRDLGILDLSAWVSRKVANWMAQLRFMQAMIETAYLDSKSGVVIKDYTTTPAAPTATLYRVVLNDLDIVVTQADTNPDIERRRVLVKYQWEMRSSN